MLQKLEKEAGKQAIEDWINMYCTDGWDDESLIEFNKADKIIQANFKSSIDPYKEIDDFQQFVLYNAVGIWNEEYHWWHYATKPTDFSTVLSALPSINQQTTNEDMPLLLNTVVESENQPKKDFSKTRYSNDFVNKYKVDSKTVTTEADKDFSQQWNEYLRRMANYLQIKIGGYYQGHALYELYEAERTVKNNSAFLSYNCKSDWIEKMKQASYK